MSMKILNGYPSDVKKGRKTIKGNDGELKGKIADSDFPDILFKSKG
tara:strand:- start:1020 stop:1157 length:138 start_codon:yes stop_codon:yes gene_type:complete